MQIFHELPVKKNVTVGSMNNSANIAFVSAT
jgi:hypothetical protein